jgi:hypothetical protein
MINTELCANGKIVESILFRHFDAACQGRRRYRASASVILMWPVKADVVIEPQPPS